MSQATDIYRKIQHAIEQRVRGQSATIRKLLAAFACGGHVLLEDLPGTGKTTLAKALAQAVQAEFHRVQFTPDLLPSDILGVTIFDQHNQGFRLHKGPVFTEILLADEINRASPRVQSALLEAMEETQVSLDGERHPLSELFFVIATQNPVEFHGTYPLPEAQLDRFAVRLSLGYVSAEEEVEILNYRNSAMPEQESDEPSISREELRVLKAAVPHVRISEELKRYTVDIIRATRETPTISMGASPRAALALMRLSQALALFDGEDFVSPEHIQEIAQPVIAHRLKMDSQAHFAGHSAENTVQDVLRQLKVPS